MFVIWLDDIRPVDRQYAQYLKKGHYADPKSVNSAKFWIEEMEKMGHTKFILDLDHDLGDYASDGGDGIKLIDWLIETGRNTPNYQIKLHTMNPVGKRNMQTTIQKYWR